MSLKLVSFESLCAVSYSPYIWRHLVSFERYNETNELLVKYHEIFIPHLYLAYILDNQIISTS